MAPQWAHVPTLKGANPGPRPFLKTAPHPPTLSFPQPGRLVVGLEQSGPGPGGPCVGLCGLGPASRAAAFSGCPPPESSPLRLQANRRPCQRKCTETLLFPLPKLELTNAPSLVRLSVIGCAHACARRYVCACACPPRGGCVSLSHTGCRVWGGHPVC